MADNQLNWYGEIFKAWQPKLMGKRPDNEHFATVHGWGYRPGVEALHLAMCLRPEGCTVAQFCMAGSCGPANNKRRQVINNGWARVTVSGKPYAFRLTITDKGLAVVKRNAQLAADKAAAATAKPVKKAKAVKAAGKPKGKGKPAKATPQAGKPETAPTVTAEAPQAPQGETPQV